MNLELKHKVSIALTIVFIIIYFYYTIKEKKSDFSKLELEYSEDTNPLNFPSAKEEEELKKQKEEIRLRNIINDEINRRNEKPMTELIKDEAASSSLRGFLTGAITGSPESAFLGALVFGSVGVLNAIITKYFGDKSNKLYKYKDNLKQKLNGETFKNNKIKNLLKKINK